MFNIHNLQQGTSCFKGIVFACFEKNRENSHCNLPPGFYGFAAEFSALFEPEGELRKEIQRISDLQIGEQNFLAVFTISY